MKRILFVDDETKILEGLQRMLRSYRKQWETSFASGGEEALKALESAPFDVIVTDMRMPGMDGAQLLEAVRERFPGVIRIVLSGHFDVQAALRAVPFAHQFLVKPCEPEALRRTIERSCACSSMVEDDATRRVVAAIGELPAMPHTYAALSRALEDSNTSLECIGRIVEEDVGVTAKVLQLVNSAFFGLAREVPNVRMAVGFLGIDVLKQLVLSVEMFRMFKPVRPIAGFSIPELQSHSRLTAHIVSRLPLPPRIAAEVAVAGLLHDTGKLVLATGLPEQFEMAIARSIDEGRPLQTVEEEMTGTSHAQMGAYLLALWGLPSPVVSAISRHHHPSVEGSGQGLDMTSAVYVANFLALECSFAPGPTMLGQEDPDLDYLRQIGVVDELPAWREMAAQAALEMAAEGAGNDF